MNNSIVETENLCKKYGNKLVVKDVNMHVRRGKIYGIIGKNGAGKTSIIKMILGLIHKTSGQVRIFGKDTDECRQALVGRIGYMIEPNGFYSNLSARENLMIYTRIQGSINPNVVMDALQAVNLPSDDRKKFRNFSLGMKQRLALALAIMNDPEIIILDEPTNGLDPIGISDMRRYIKKLQQERNKTILLSSHQLSEVEVLADDIGIIDDGRILAECEIEKIKKESKQSIKVEVDNIKKSAVVLEAKGIKNFVIQGEHQIAVYEKNISSYDINRMLMDRDIKVSTIFTEFFNLERYFNNAIGGKVNP
ncbi:ABC transporter ATP-binding protein [Lachnotalea glycerini]|uniref:ABC transporter ATP-binding protein n=1 Tax=Lachnotalea glycerini TaxID=1763509 RepID=A0A371J993_9FIRM|nr:ABC transporter ATP-binding protein [Lachnotalea glycerini]RDY29314.1 ABC transporter ATP-binding protein [Lachnotalea glycerini]